MPNSDGTLTDNEVFGNNPPQLQSGELTDAQVFGMPVAASDSGQSLPEKIAHYAGLGLGAVDRGIAGFADMGPEAVNAVSTAITNNPNNDYTLPLPATILANKFIQSSPSTQPQTPGEQKFQDLASAGVTGAPFGPTSAIMSVTGAAGGQLAAAAGATPREQMLAAALTGSAAGAGTGVARMAIGPSTSMGRAAAMGQYLLKNTQNPESTISNLENVPEYVADSPVTAGPASQDYGLMGLERGVKNLQGSNFGETLANQNAARMAVLNGIAGTPKNLADATTARDVNTAPLYRKAQDDFVNTEAISPIIDQIDGALSNVGTQTGAGKILSKLRSNIIASMPEDEDAESHTMGPLIQVYREARDNAAAGVDAANAYSPAIKGVVQPIIDDLGAAMEGSSDNLKVANDAYKQMSEPINQMQLLQKLRDDIGTSNTDLSTQTRLMSQAKLAGRLKIKGDEMQSTLTPDQMNVVTNIEKDANRSNAVNSPLVRPAGSDTAANNLLAQGMGKVANKASFGLLSDASVDPVKVAAILQDPQKTRQMLIQAMNAPNLKTRIGKNYAALGLGDATAQSQALAYTSALNAQGGQ